MAEQSPQAGEWVLVPRKATFDMAWNAFEEAGHHMQTHNGWQEPAEAIYRAMLAAAPAVPPSAARIAALLAEAHKALQDIAYMRPLGPTCNKLAMKMERVAVDALDAAAAIHARSLLSTKESE